MGIDTYPIPITQPITGESQKQPAGNANLTGRLFPLGAFDASMRGVNTQPPVLLIQVSKIENGYVIGIAGSSGALPKLIYATDLTDVGHQITAFAVTLELEGKGAKT